MDKRKALGRGLGALIPEAPAAGGAAAPRRDYFVVGIEEIHPSGDNPRQAMDEGELAELAESIRRQGILQPLLVRTRPPSEGGGFTLIAGERRWRAAQRAGLKDVPVVVKEATAKEAFELALIENLQRADLNPIEEAEGYRRMCDDYGYTQEQLAERIGKDRTTVLNSLRLLRLPLKVRGMLAERKLQMGHARALLGAGGDRAIEEAATRVVAKGLSVRQTEELVRRERAREEKGAVADEEPTSAKSASVRDLEGRLERALGARVRIAQKGTEAGRIEIDYVSLDDLDRLLEKLLRP